MEVTQVGVRTRARAMAMLTEEIADNPVAVKRRKLRLPSPSPFVETKTLDCEILVNNSVLKEKRNGSRRSGGVPATCCSSAGSIEKLKVSDLEESVDQTEIEITARYNLEGNESTPGELQSTTAKKQSMVMKILPPEAELEEFFAAAQESLNERFKNKYNYDIVNDIPLEGRFEWIEVNPELTAITTTKMKTIRE